MKLIIIILLLLFSCNLRSEIVVIGNLNNDLKTMTKKEIKEIFMGRARTLPNKSFALPFDFPELRARFYYILTGRPIEQINAYWARIMFTGQAYPPTKLNDSQAVIRVVSENKGAIGYIDSQYVDTSLMRVLLVLD